ncbi:MAG: hypothetical protein ACRYHQ_05480 [Janthinobacterium lividum]
MAGLRIGVDVGGLLPTGGAVNADMLPHLAHAVRSMGQLAHSQWLDYAMGAPLPSGRVMQNRTGEYARSILRVERGPFSQEIVSHLPYAAAIEYGTKAYDQKKMLDSSLKVRLTKTGKRYLIIPFRWNTPGSVLGHNLPVEVFNWWQEAGRLSSHITDTHRRVSGTGAYDIHTREKITVSARTYSWGSRLGTGSLHQLGFFGNDKMHKRLKGMVNFRNPEKGSGGSHSQYLTFRVMMEGSKGWVKPAQAGFYPARATADKLASVSEEIIEKAMTYDISRLVGMKG